MLQSQKIVFSEFVDEDDDDKDKDDEGEKDAAGDEKTEQEDLWWTPLPSTLICIANLSEVLYALSISISQKI